MLLKLHCDILEGRFLKIIFSSSLIFDKHNMYKEKKHRNWFSVENSSH